MGWQFRKSKRFGPLRLTASKRGASLSGGVGPVRLSKSTTGRKSFTFRLLRGLFWRKTKG